MNELKDSDILYIYDAKLTNPNGDPDEQNKPRIDEITRRCLVSDVRLKRYLRDYWLENDKDIWIRKLDSGKVASATDRLKELANKFEKKTGDKINIKKPTKEFMDWVLDELIDIRLFGATMPIKGDDGGSGASSAFTGPVQFSWGYSFHPVELVLSSGITSMFAGRDKGEDDKHGTMAKDWRLHYALIGFYGHISKSRAQWTRLKTDDLDILEDGLINAIPHQATSRSKLGQVPRIYINVRYKKYTPLIGDLRDYVTLKPKDNMPIESLRSVHDYQLDISKLGKVIMDNQDCIEDVRLWTHPHIHIEGMNELEKLQCLIKL